MESIGNAEEVKGKNNSKGKIVLLVVGIILILSIVLMISRNVYTKSVVKDQLALGQQYLDEMKYEEAIAAFETVLQIDSKNIPGLENISQAYVGKAETDSENIYTDILETYEKAVEYAEHAYDYYPDDEEVIGNLFSVYMSTADYCVKNQDYEKAEEYYEKIMEIETTDEDNLDLQEEAEKKAESMKKRAQYEEMMKVMFETFQSEGVEATFSLMYQEDYQKMAESLDEGESFYYGEYDDNGERNGQGVAVYYIKETDITDHWVPVYYLGSWKDGIREGDANWVCSTGELDTRHYVGSWKNDKPNGSFEKNSYFDYSDMNPTEGKSYYEKFNVVDGLFDGDYIQIFKLGNGTESQWTFSYQAGKVKVLREEDYSEDEYRFVIAESTDYGNEGSYVFSEEQVNMTHGVIGFADTSW